MGRADDFRHRVGVGVDRGRGRHRHLLRSRIWNIGEERIVTAAEIIDRHPDIIIGSWCGKKFRPEKVVARLSFEQIPAVQNNGLHEIKSPIILQPGPAALTDGLMALLGFPPGSGGTRSEHYAASPVIPSMTIRASAGVL
jgi:hypothetical protein